jgi:hypothetical protein
MSYALGDTAALSQIGSAFSSGAAAGLTSADMQRLFGPMIPDIISETKKQILPWVLAPMLSIVLLQVYTLIRK